MLKMHFGSFISSICFSKVKQERYNISTAYFINLAKNFKEIIKEIDKSIRSQIFVIKHVRAEKSFKIR